MIPYDRRAWVRLLFASRGSLEHAVISRVVGFGILAVVLEVLDRYTPIPVRAPMGFHEIAGLVIGLVLAFRTNTAYARFWEGRQLWGGIVNSTRNITRILTNHAGLDESEAHVIRTWLVVLAHSTRCRLRGQADVPEAAGLLSPEDYQHLLAAPHTAIFCADQVSRRITGLAGQLDPILCGVAEQELNVLVNAIGGCERILRTPTPLGYVLLIERTIFLYLATLPFALFTRLGMLTPLVTIAVSYLVLMIDTLGNELDNPFGMDASDIAMDRICSNIAFELLGIGHGPSVELPKGIGPVLH